MHMIKQKIVHLSSKCCSAKCNKIEIVFDRQAVQRLVFDSH